jgi:RNA polymerase subunit RPABC4/transcription elongation factor Spt4
MFDYTFGECKRCGKLDTLKNEICVKCSKNEQFYDWLSDALKDINKEKTNGL